MYQKVLKGEAVENARKQAEDQYRAKFVLKANKAKDALIIKQADLSLATAKGYSGREMSDWFAELERHRSQIALLETEYQKKLDDVEKMYETAEFWEYMERSRREAVYTEEDYEMVKMANQYGIVEDD
jgi:hypothetical protein